MSQTPLTDAYLASRCKGENKQSWVEFARGLELRFAAGLFMPRQSSVAVQDVICDQMFSDDWRKEDERFKARCRSEAADLYDAIVSQIGIDQSHI